MFIFSQCRMSSVDENRGQNWRDAEIVTLIKIWAEEEIQKEFEKSRRNAGTFIKIAQRMKDAGYDRNGDQCRTKIKKLKNQYINCRKENNKSGAARNAFQFYEEMDRVLGHRPSTEPALLIDTSASFETSDDDDDGRKMFCYNIHLFHVFTYLRIKFMRTVKLLKIAWLYCRKR